ncbi:hypothetical protein AQ490_07205 [Wenjunlia vitaminophila]|uniref:HTH araC/xylS-type domain-containing protein n=1 Tax=Wenjunlia vitaminophila TaxID=76728 RepID=A0A0T6LMW7_WENVI|nr:helix-turn-helix domain-containing protein [Wenjunlia vitaminophila]KRV47257.1 hypothetical protein AQ490_07205 [Wenjunlia vitaminophila]
MNTMVGTHDSTLPTSERITRLRELCLGLPVAVRVEPDPSLPFRGDTSFIDLGAVSLLSVHASPSELRRTRKMIGCSDPGMLRLDLLHHGRKVFRLDRQETELRPGELLLSDSSQEFHVSTVAADGDTWGTVMMFPRTLLPLSPHLLKHSLGTPLPGRDGVGALLSGLLTTLTSDNGQFERCDTDSLGRVVLDLLAAMCVTRLDACDAPAPESGRRALRVRIRSFILHHLHDPWLDPRTIAAAHNISVRYLHKLFQDEGCTVAEWIRQRRLERCQRDLANPALCHRPIRTIATCWGFPNAAHFSRAFRAAYGLPPREYRERSLHGAAVRHPASVGRSVATTS